jgi:hypothetical protein
MKSIKSMTVFTLALFVVGCSLTVAAPPRRADKWDKYIPEKDRKSIMKAAQKSTGVSAVMVSGTTATLLWLTDRVARCAVSVRIDRERLDAEEAEAGYKLIRSKADESYLFWMTISTGAPSLSGAPGPRS